MGSSAAAKIIQTKQSFTFGSDSNNCGFKTPNRAVLTGVSCSRTGGLRLEFADRDWKKGDIWGNLAVQMVPQCRR